MTTHHAGLILIALLMRVTEGPSLEVPHAFGCFALEFGDVLFSARCHFKWRVVITVDIQY